MEVFEVVVALLLGGAALAALARRIGAPYPALVALAGAALALIPGVPMLVLDPELALALFVAPVLVDAAFDASPRDLRANWRQVASLALGAVALTIVVVAVVARLLVPDMPWAAAIALGAIVAPPDAAAVVGWCGMRGTVTLAAALALPTGQYGGAPFPHRDLIVVTAFGVVLGTLVLQGLTLRPLLLRLRLEDDGAVEREVRFARVDVLRAALAATDACPGAEAAALVRHSYEVQLRRAEEELGRDGGNEARDASTIPAAPVDADAAVVRAATGAQRKRLVALRADGTIGDAAFQRLEEELDWAELGWAQVLPPEERATA